PYHYKVSIETNGTISTRRFRVVQKPNPDICLMVDYKFDRHNPDAFRYLREMDWIKIVVGGHDDFDCAREMFIKFREMGCKARFALSPVHEVLPGKVLAEWILDAHLWDVS